VNFLVWFLSRRDRNDWTSRRSLIVTLPFVLGVVFIAPQAIKEGSAAKRQQTIQGSVTSYERFNHNQCQYVFSVWGKQYAGIASAPRDHVTVGDQVRVYFDSQNPTVNSLEDFSQISQRAKRDVYFLVAVIVAFACFIFVSKIASVPVKGRSVDT